MAVEAGCKKPESISTTRMRKYTATVLQLLSLDAGELEWVSNHLGHNVDINRTSYRLHESTIECAKVAKLLLAVESGTVSKYKGSTLEDLELNDIDIALEQSEDSFTDSEDGEGHEESEVASRPTTQKKRTGEIRSRKRARVVIETDEEDSATSDHSQNVEPKPTMKKKRKREIRKRKKARVVIETDEEDSATSDSSQNDEITARKKKEG